MLFPCEVSPPPLLVAQIAIAWPRRQHTSRTKKQPQDDDDYDDDDDGDDDDTGRTAES